MKWCRQILCVALTACSAVPVLAQSPRAQSDQELLVELERGWNAAVYRNDAEFIANVLADEFMATYADGSRGDKARELALAAAFNQQVESAVQDDFTVKIYGDTGVVWLTLHLVGTRQGQRAEVTFRFTDVFVWRDGRWQCVSSQSTRLDPQ